VKTGWQPCGVESSLILSPVESWLSHRLL